MFCFYGLLTLLQFRKYTSFFILANKKGKGNGNKATNVAHW